MQLALLGAGFITNLGEEFIQVAMSLTTENSLFVACSATNWLPCPGDKKDKKKRTAWNMIVMIY